MLLNLLLGLLLAVFIALAAWKARALNPSGGLAAVGLGTIFFGLGGLGWAVLLLAFFISSSGLSKLFKRRKLAFDEKFSKGNQRDAAQVLANGGVAGLFALLHVFFPQALWPWLGCSAALAAANADTWATELGVLSRTLPVSITTGQKVERGTSGGISLTGTLAALAGSVLIALIGVIFWQGSTGLRLADLSPSLAGLMGAVPAPISLTQRIFWFSALSLAGLAGSLVDSFLGATVQAIYTCSKCQKETERHPLHTCGSLTTLQRGWPWLNNDWVNSACTLSAALLVILLNGWL